MGNDSDAMSQVQALSGRKGSKKVRTGCITCKIRKVKCDEAKPFCMRCTKTGRKCDGYLDAKTLAQRRRRRSGADSYASLTVFYEWASPDEKRSFHFFQHVTAPGLSGDLDSVFWRVLVLQICQTEPAVKHAVLAVSSLHEGMMIQSGATPYADSDERQSFALQEYNKAIACLLDQMRNADAKPLVPLLTCLLFVCIEFIQSKDKESIIHLGQGRQILSQLERKCPIQSTEIEIIKQHLVPMYTRLSLTSSLLGGSPAAIPLALKTITEVPPVFGTIDEVRYVLYDLMDEVLRFTEKSRPIKIGDEIAAEEMRALELEQDGLVRKLAKFNVAFSLYRASKPKDSRPGHLDLLQVHVHTTSIWISTALSRNETVYDDHLAAFSAIIPLAASVMDNPEPSVPREKLGKAPGSWPLVSQLDNGGLSGMFTFETHVIAPLYYVATKCRHPLIRGAALDLLRRNPSRRENLWRANAMAAIAELNIKLEERHLHQGSPSPALIPTPEAFTGALTSAAVWATSNFPNQITASNALQAERKPSSQELRHSEGEGDASQDVEIPPIDPYLLLDRADMSDVHSASGPGSMTSSIDDHHGLDSVSPYLGRSSGTVPLDMATSWPALSEPAMTPGISLEPPTPLDYTLSHGIAFRSSYTGSDSPSVVSDGGAGSSHDLLFPGLAHQRRSELQFQQIRRSLEAPFDLPENVRIHHNLIGPEKEDGSWVTVFRKLGGLDAPDWDVQTEFVAVT